MRNTGSYGGVMIDTYEALSLGLARECNCQVTSYINGSFDDYFSVWSSETKKARSTGIGYSLNFNVYFIKDTIRINSGPEYEFKGELYDPELIEKLAEWCKVTTNKRLGPRCG